MRDKDKDNVILYSWEIKIFTKKNNRIINYNFISNLFYLSIKLCPKNKSYIILDRIIVYNVIYGVK